MPMRHRNVTGRLQRRLSRASWIALAAAAAAAAAVPVVAAPPPGIIAVDEISPGMTGYGLTVFSGTRVDTFAVTVLGVQHRTRAAGDVIVIEVGGHDLELSAVAQGMSGSPIYLDDRFAGALAFGWSGALRPIAGVTPAAEVLALPSAQPEPARQTAPTMESRRTTAPPDGTVALLGEPYPVALAADLFGASAAGPAPPPASSLPSGWPRPTELLADLLPTSTRSAATANAAGPTPLPAGWIYQPLRGDSVGSGVARAGAPLVPGAACAVPLIVGDAQLGALGTVTWVDDERVLMFGHPFMQRGPVNLPLAAAEIVSVFPSRQLSFKIGSIGPVVGSVLHDQRAGLVGRLGAEPPLIPVGVELQRPEGHESYTFAVADDPTLGPALVFWCLYNALLVRGDDQSRQTLRYEITSNWTTASGESLVPVVLSGQVAGPGGAAALAGEWMTPLQMLLNNRHRTLTLQGVDARMSVTRPLETATIVAATLPAGAHAGETVDVGVTLQPYRGDARQVTLSLALPQHVVPGSYRLAVANARELFALEAERAAGRFEDHDLDTTLELIRTPRSAATLTAALFGPPQSVVVAGRELGPLPDSVARTLQAGRDGVTTPTRAAYVARTEHETELFLQGHVVRKIQILPPTAPIRQEPRP
jgi:hypothetical protein